MKNLTRNAVPLFLLFVLAHIAVAQSRPKENADKPTGSISGRITVGDKPAAGIVVALVPAGVFRSRGFMPKTSTDADGRYRLSEVPAGQYNLLPLSPAHIVPSDSLNGIGKALNLSANENVEGFDFKLTRGGVITGRVIDADGKPLVEERVQLQPVDANGAGAPWTGPPAFNSQMYQTDDRGIYRIYGLPAGRYKVATGDDPSSGMSSLYRRGGYYQRIYHPDAVDIAKATVVELSEGGEARNVDITLGRRAAVYTASGRIIDSEKGQPLAGVSFFYGMLPKNANNFTSTVSGAPSNSRGEFRLEGLEPGRYGIYVGPGFREPTSDRSSEPVIFEIIDSDLTNLEVKASRGASLSGFVLPDGITNKTALARLLTLRLGASIRGSGEVQTNTFASMTTAAGGSFQIYGLPPGKAFIYLSSSGDPSLKGFVIARIDRDGIEQNQGIEIAAGENVTGVRIFIAYGTGIIRGNVKIEGGTLPSDIQMFIRLTRDGISLNREVAQVDSRGRFTIDALPAGTYELQLTYFSRSGTPLPRRPALKQLVNVAEGGEAEVLFTIDLSPRREGQ